MSERTMPPSHAVIYSEGDRCTDCRHWWWKDDLWHSLIPKSYADTPELELPVLCPKCFDAAQEEMP